MNLIELSYIIENFYAKSKIEKVLSILKELRSGNYYANSKTRNILINRYKDTISTFSETEYNIIKDVLIKEIPSLIADRNSRKITYFLLSQIIQYSCNKNFEIYNAYENKIFKSAYKNRDKYLYHFITLAQTRNKLFNNISNLEDIFISIFLKPTKFNKINFKYIIDFTSNVENVSNRKILTYLYTSRPFVNEYIINRFILMHEDLKKFGTLF